MMQPATNNSAQRIKLSVYQLNHLTAHPACVARCADFLSQAKPYKDISIFPESDPAIALAIINLCRQKNIRIDFKNSDFPTLMKHLPRNELLKTILSLKIYDTQDIELVSLIGSFIHRSSTRAFAAKLIAQKAYPTGVFEAHLAALFADTGLFAIAQLFSKTLLMLYAEAAEQNVSLIDIEKEHLGITDNILSQMLLEKWQFGSAIADAGWLYSTDADALIDKLPDGKIISIVRLADMLTDSQHRQGLTFLKQKLAVTDSDINEIRQQTQIFEQQLGETLGIDFENIGQLYFETIKRIYLNQITAVSSEDIFLQFIQKFAAALNPQSAPIGIAEVCVRIISEFFLVQSICVFTADACRADLISASVIDGGSARLLLINCPPGFSITDATPENLQPWFYEQTGIKVENSRFIPIQNQQQTIAGIVLCGYIPDEALFEQITGILGRIFALSSLIERQKATAQLATECLVSSKLQTAVEPAVSAMPAESVGKKESFMEIAAELAAGAAHELNNPLAVISGRAQLLLQSETDETKKLALNQIVSKAGEIHEIFGQLMSYANPPAAQIRPVSPFIVINNSLEKVKARYQGEPLDIHLENIETLDDIKADSEQIAEAIAQIIYNSLESYESGNGPVHIIGSRLPQDNFVEIKIVDNGCGMSNETLQKAVHPFFSDKSAGRQRGMGLSLAASLLKNNGCTLKIESQLDKGTTVTINMPCAEKS